MIRAASGKLIPIIFDKGLNRLIFTDIGFRRFPELRFRGDSFLFGQFELHGFFAYGGEFPGVHFREHFTAEAYSGISGAPELETIVEILASETDAHIVPPVLGCYGFPWFDSEESQRLRLTKIAQTAFFNAYFCA